MKVNVVRILDDSDYRCVKQLCDRHEGWEVAYSKKTTTVWMKAVDDSSLAMIKARAEFKDVSASVAYDVLHDPVYRPKWDKYMMTTKEVGLINPNNDVCYYALGGIPPFRSRDFVMQRSWLDLGTEKYICGHSVCHERHPPTKTHVRGVVRITAYFVRAISETSCQITYLTHSDPKGKLPTWFVNRISKVVAPKLFKKLHKACLNYADWKRQNGPEHKPWLFPEQQEAMPRINLAECVPRDYDEVTVDETAISLKDVNEKDDAENDDE